jgi:transposase
MSLLASITKEGGMGACSTVEGATTKEVFETYIEKVPAPTASRDRGQVVVLDSLSSHKRGRVRELIEGRGCELIYLPPYFNRIERAFSKIKTLLREARARLCEALVEAIGKALWAISPGDSQGFFEHCGYHAMGQSL